MGLIQKQSRNISKISVHRANARSAIHPHSHEWGISRILLKRSYWTTSYENPTPKAKSLDFAFFSFYRLNRKKLSTLSVDKVIHFEKNP
jgi:hypothetical protein